MTKRPSLEIVQERLASLPRVVIQMPMCKCGRAPWRKGQKNCHFCNLEAGRKFKAELRKQSDRVNLRIITMKSKP